MALVNGIQWMIINAERKENKLKKYLFTFSNKGSTQNRPEVTDQTFDSIQEIKDYIKSHNYGSEYDYHVWVQEIGIQVQTSLDFIETPPTLT